MSEVFPIEIKIEPKSRAEQERLLAALGVLVSEDPTFLYDIDLETGEINLAGQGELHLDHKIHFIKERFGIDVAVGAPQIVYLEVLARPVEISLLCQPIELHPSGVKIEISARPLERGDGDVFINAANGVVSEDVAAVAAGIDWVRNRGNHIALCLVDSEVTLRRLDRIGESVSASTIKMAARQAMIKACAKNVELIEPVMAVCVRTPQEFVGSIIRDIISRRGQICAQRLDEPCVVIEAYAPIANLFGFSNTLRNMTAGQGTYSMTYSHYEFLPNYNSQGPGDDFPPAVGKRA